MLVAIVAGVILGFVLSIPPGPVGVYAMKLGLNSGARQGTYYAMGSGIMDFLYCTFAMFATSAMLSMLGDFVQQHPNIILAIQLVIVVAVILYGIMQLRRQKQKEKELELGEQEMHNPNRFYRYIKTLSNKGPFLFGIAIALTNIANPAFLPFLGYVTMHVHSAAIIEDTFMANLIFSLSFGVGNFLWLYLIIRLLLRYKPMMSSHFISRINQFAGYSMIGVGTLLGYRVAISHWPDLIRVVVAF